MSRWLDETEDRGDSYDERFRALAASGVDVHGEAAFVSSSVTPGARVLDAGCGTGRVAIELARRGFDVTGVDLDPSMLRVARARSPELSWHLADLATLELAGAAYDLVLVAGNVMIYLAPGTEGVVLQRLAAQLRPGGPLVAGFSLEPDRLELAHYDELAAAAGLALVERWATWDRLPFDGGNYAVSVHRKRSA